MFEVDVCTVTLFKKLPNWRIHLDIFISSYFNNILFTDPLVHNENGQDTVSGHFPPIQIRLFVYLNNGAYTT